MALRQVLDLRVRVMAADTVATQSAMVQPCVWTALGAQESTAVREPAASMPWRRVLAIRAHVRKGTQVTQSATVQPRAMTRTPV